MRAMPRDPELTKRAREMRRKPTAGEARLWHRLRGRQLGVRFRRQEPIGPYVADFVCKSTRLVVEVDGPTHQLQHDLDRDAAMLSRGYRILRFTDQEVYEDIDAVVDAIARALPRLAFGDPTPPA